MGKRTEKARKNPSVLDIMKERGKLLVPNPNTVLDGGNQKIVWVVVKGTLANNLYQTKFLGRLDMSAFSMTSKRVTHPFLRSRSSWHLLCSAFCLGLLSDNHPSCCGSEPERLQAPEYWDIQL